MIDALLAFSRTGRTTDPLLARIFTAKQVNLALGGPFISPWEVDDLPDEFLDAIRAMYTDLSQMRAGFDQVKKIFEAWRRKHPTYRK